MSKSDRLKAEIAFHEKMFFAALAVFVALIAWAVENYQAVNGWILATAAAGSTLAIGFGLWNYRQIQALLKELSDA
ncbi:hypothetical protein FKG94_06195 [Exilibacterium tricleocarpae]|uniref:Uncharacterized protein n=1 Tax=Exilibacterium tricleocarpae TaxID=2591008 RepID=A0A545U452_9GAMM|nr:hypothetical protein [Exilibacterium tricleocarpae]TQV84245.1 hypothetical protein FKG94_06195 [Exilibacterium tricleocarpae]